MTSSRIPGRDEALRALKTWLGEQRANHESSIAHRDPCIQDHIKQLRAWEDALSAPVQEPTAYRRKVDGYWLYRDNLKGELPADIRDYAALYADPPTPPDHMAVMLEARDALKGINAHIGTAEINACYAALASLTRITGEQT